MTQTRPTFRHLGTLLIAAFALLGVAGPAHAVTNTQASQAAINFLSGDAAVFSTNNGCTACHRQGAAVFAIASAEANGYNMNAAASNGSTNGANLAYLSNFLATRQLASGAWPHSIVNSDSGWGAFGVAGYDRYVSTQYSANLVRFADWALPRQTGGRWIEDHNSYPVNWGNVMITARYMVAIAQAKQRVDPAKAAQYQAALDNAAAYLRANINNGDGSWFGDGMPYANQVAWAIVGLNAAGVGPNGANTITIDTLANRLLNNMANNQGWGQTPAHAPDLTNSGTSLYALCVAGRGPANEPRIQNAIDWLKSGQNANGSFGGGATIDITTTFAMLGLSCFGDYGVSVTVLGPSAIVLDGGSLNQQTAVYTFKVRNLGYQPDTYNLTWNGGGLANWSATVEPSVVSLAAGAEATVTLTVNTPAGLPNSLNIEYTVTATSTTQPGVSNSARIAVMTNPPPPITGQASTTTILSPAPGATVTVGTSVLLSARVTNNVTGVVVAGPNRGVVNFFIAGIAVGSDTDADGNGVFQFNWTPGNGSWTNLGSQDFRAVYSGVTLQPASPNILGSSASQTLNIVANPVVSPKITLCNLPRYTKETSIRLCGFITSGQPGAAVNYAAFIVDGGAPVQVIPEPSGGRVELWVTLTDGAHSVKLFGTDTAGNFSEKITTITVDRTAPTLTILSPAADAVVGSTFTVTSQVSDAIPVTVTTQRVSSTSLATGNGVVAHSVTATTGGFLSVLVRAQDAAGNFTERRVRVFVELSAPTISTVPTNGALFGPRANNQVPYTVRISSATATTIQISNGGGDHTLPRGGGIIQTLINATPGQNTFTIRATSERGQVSTLTQSFIYDIAAPSVVQWNSPVANQTYSGIITLSATVSDDFSGVASVAFTRDNSSIVAGTASGNVWTATLDTNTLSNGAHTVEARMTDNAGNLRIQSVSFNVNN